MPIKLTDLDPRWLTFEGMRRGITFKCPHCQKVWLTCFTEPMPLFGDGCIDEDVSKWNGLSQFVLWRDAVGMDVPQIEMVGCTKGIAWTATPPIGEATFENLSFTPSLDASKAGHWHGFITNGVVS